MPFPGMPFGPFKFVTFTTKENSPQVNFGLRRSWVTFQLSKEGLVRGGARICERVRGFLLGPGVHHPHTV